MPDYGFVEARVRATAMLPYIAPYVVNLIPVEKKGLETMAVDDHMRVYYDPDLYASWSIDKFAAVILHETMHVMLRHSDRAIAHIGPTPSQAERVVWNLAGDMSINYMLRASANTGRIPIRMPEDCVFPETFKMPENLSTEQYYEELCKKINPAKFQKSMEEGKPFKVPGTNIMLVPKEDVFGPGDMPSGGAADGQGRPWEAPGKPGEGEAEGSVPQAVGKHEQHMLERQAAKAVQEAKSRGNCPGGWDRWADEVLKPKYDPRELLRSVVRWSLNCIPGFGDHTYRRLKRRQPPGMGRLPSHIQPLVRCMVIVDTSGSMNKDDLALSLGVIAETLKAMPQVKLSVITGDTRAHTCQEVFNVREVKMAGGGGTDCGAMIVDAVKNAKKAPDVVICCTDGYTPWPDKPVGPRVIACVTQKHSDWPVPDWITTVYINPEDAKKK